MNLKYQITHLLFLFGFIAFSQEFPPIVKYDSKLYAAGNQNWMISQDKNRFLYFANNEGLLVFNGSTWKLYPSPNETIIRSVKVIGEKIYTGAYMEFGYWKRKADGNLEYYSLSSKIKSKILDDEQFWNIFSDDHLVVFQSLNRIFIYNSQDNRFKIITPKSLIFRAYETKKGIYFQTNNEGLFEIEGGEAKLITDDFNLKKSRIVNVFERENGLLILTDKSGVFSIEENKINRLATEIDFSFSEEVVYSGIELLNGDIALGTISNGIFIITKDGKYKFHISQKKGLSNNTALSLLEDKDKNLWVGLDNGINCININSPIQNYVDNSGVLGTVYTSQLFDGKLYVGTNQGLFVKDYKSNDDFSIIRGTKGQVWSLFVHDGTLFCGHDLGTFEIKKDSARLIFSQSGTWTFSVIPGSENKLLQGNYYGISVLEKKDGQWGFRNKIKGFDYSARYFEITKNFEIYVSHEYKGVFRLTSNSDLQLFKENFAYQTPIKGKNSSLVKFNNVIYYANREGVFKLENNSKKFQKDSILSLVFENDEYTSGKMIADKSNKLWFFSKNYIHYYESGKLINNLRRNSIPIPAVLTNSMLGFENLTQLSGSKYLFGTTDGYYTMNVNDLNFENYKLSISNISSNTLDGNLKLNSIYKQGLFQHDENNLTFYYTVPAYNKYINVEYQYILFGFQEKWSEWSTQSSVNFKNLPPGNYVLKVRARIANAILENSAQYNFTILKPWYSTNLAIVIYLILGLIIIRLIHKEYKKYYQRQREKLIEENNLLLEIKELENEQYLMRLKNEKLSKDVDEINKELAASTMSLHNKNELLAIIQKDLKENEDGDSLNIKNVITTINKNITEKDSWSVFQEAFNKTDKDFLKNMKDAHPSLTANDLRLCAYLRLNLSSKEIAPLLNISVRSVEIKRYRLRKKMELDRDQGLVEYILTV